jgi:hypothetical protein
MPDDRDMPGADERMQANVAGEPLTASVKDILDEHADAERRAAEERRAEEATRERVLRRKAEEEETVLRHTGGQRRLRPSRRAVQMRRSERADGGGEEALGALESSGVDPRLLIGGALLGVVLAGGMRRLIFLGAIAAGGWALYRRVLEPARDPSVVLQ